MITQLAKSLDRKSHVLRESLLACGCYGLQANKKGTEIERSVSVDFSGCICRAKKRQTVTCGVMK